MPPGPRCPLLVATGGGREAGTSLGGPLTRRRSAERGGHPTTRDRGAGFTEESGDFPFIEEPERFLAAISRFVRDVVSL